MKQLPSLTNRINFIFGFIPKAEENKDLLTELALLRQRARVTSNMTAIFFLWVDCSNLLKDSLSPFSEEWQKRVWNTFIGQEVYKTPLAMPLYNEEEFREYLPKE